MEIKPFYKLYTVNDWEAVCDLCEFREAPTPRMTAWEAEPWKSTSEERSRGLSAVQLVIDEVLDSGRYAVLFTNVKHVFKGEGEHPRFLKFLVQESSLTAKRRRRRVV